MTRLTPRRAKSIAFMVEEILTAILALAYVLAIFACWIVFDPIPDQRPAKDGRLSTAYAAPASRRAATSAAVRPCGDDGGSYQQPRDAIAQLLQAN